MHWLRWQRTGDPRPDQPRRVTGIPEEERFLPCVEMTDGCWLWTGRLTDQGYASFTRTGSRVPTKGHRWAYEYWVGPIPDGMVLDHTCHSFSDCPGGKTCPHRRCVNPAHLEPVTEAENKRRGAPQKRTHCPQGHPYNEANTYRDSNGARHCRTCRRVGMRKAYSGKRR